MARLTNFPRPGCRSQFGVLCVNGDARCTEFAVGHRHYVGPRYRRDLNLSVLKAIHLQPAVVVGRVEMELVCVGVTDRIRTRNVPSGLAIWFGWQWLR